MAEEKKPTLKELLERHNISYLEFYEHCVEVSTEEINATCNHNVCTRTGITKMIAWVNKHANTSYTIEDVYVEEMY